MTSKYFHAGSAELHVGKYPVMYLVNRYGTPLYVYDGETIKRKYNIIKKLLPDFDIFYSLKANPNISICSWLRSLGAGAEVSSGGELYKALRAGFKRNDIIFLGPGKTNEELKYAIENNIYGIVVESANELQRVDTLGKAFNKKVKAILRINLKEWRGASPEIMVGGPSKFGIDEEDVINVVNSVNLSNTEIIGIHVYAASQILDVNLIIQTFQRILELAFYYSDKLGFELKCIDFGGGWGIPYKEEEKELDISALSNGIYSVLNSKQGILDLQNVRLIFELGRYLVAESGIYLTRIINIKQSRGKKYLICDGGINQQIRPTFMNLNHPTLIVNKMTQEKEEVVQIVGPLCTPFDVLAKDVHLPKAEIGDIIGIFNSGAYGFSMSMLNFLSHPWPAEVLVVGEQIFQIRKRGNFEKLVEEEFLVIP